MTRATSSAHDFAALLAHNRAIMGQRDALAARLSASGKPVRLYKAAGWRYALAQADMSAPGMFRVTFFDDGGASGHVQFNTLHAAIYEALQMGYEPRGS